MHDPRPDKRAGVCYAGEGNQGGAGHPASLQVMDTGPVSL